MTPCTDVHVLVIMQMSFITHIFPSGWHHLNRNYIRSICKNLGKMGLNLHRRVRVCMRAYTAGSRNSSFCGTALITKTNKTGEIAVEHGNQPVCVRARARALLYIYIRKIETQKCLQIAARKHKLFIPRASIKTWLLSFIWRRSEIVSSSIYLSKPNAHTHARMRMGPDFYVLCKFRR